MVNELLDENTFRNVLPQQQKSLIAQHCRGIVGLIRSAQNPDQAKGIVERACEAFEKECSSPLIRRALSTYLTEKQREIWNHDTKRDLH